MPKNKWSEDWLVLCPYYMCNSKTAVKCESLIKGIACDQTMIRSEDRELYMNSFCRKRFNCCRHYIALNEKYKKKDES